MTCDPDSEAFALAELREIRPDLPAPVWLDSDPTTEGSIALVQPRSAFAAFADQVNRHAPVFIRHLAPAQREIALSATESDLARLREAALALAPQLDPAQTFAVQSRIVGEGRLPYRKVVLNETLSRAIEAQTSAVMDCRHPAQVVSVLCTPSVGYVGVSLATQNRSDWPGGKHRFQHEPGQISRAEFKLLEALSVFSLRLPDAGVALDMGAAPGGWTRALRAHGLRVLAVDPAELDARLMEDGGVIAIRQRIETYLPRAPSVAVIVNDMKMDALESVAIMRRARAKLEPGGLAVLTLKLPKEGKAARESLTTVRESLAELAQDYVVLGARQLYHNRSEVTVALRA